MGTVCHPAEKTETLDAAVGRRRGSVIVRPPVPLEPGCGGSCVDGGGYRGAKLKPKWW